MFQKKIYILIYKIRVKSAYGKWKAVLWLIGHGYETATCKLQKVESVQLLDISRNPSLIFNFIFQDSSRSGEEAMSKSVQFIQNSKTFFFPFKSFSIFIQEAPINMLCWTADRKLMSRLECTCSVSGEKNCLKGFFFFACFYNKH